MERVPSAMLQTVDWILLTTRVPAVRFAYESANLTGLSELQLRNARRYFHSVMSLVGTDGDPQITFYHASFMDFVEDPARSGRFYIWLDCAIMLLEEVLRHLNAMGISVDANGEQSPCNFASMYIHDLCSPKWVSFSVQTHLAARQWDPLELLLWSHSHFPLGPSVCGFGQDHPTTPFFDSV